MEAKIEAEVFQIEDHYANVIMIIFVCMMFSGGIPLMIPISFLGLATRYIYFKYSFIRFCRVPQTFNDSINNKILRILPFCFIVHFALDLWMYGVPLIFSTESSWFSDWVFYE